MGKGNGTISQSSCPSPVSFGIKCQDVEEMSSNHFAGRQQIDIHTSSFPSMHSFDKFRHCFFPKVLPASLALKLPRAESQHLQKPTLNQCKRHPTLLRSNRGGKDWAFVCNQPTDTSCCHNRYYKVTIDIYHTSSGKNLSFSA